MHGIVVSSEMKDRLTKLLFVAAHAAQLASRYAESEVEPLGAMLVSCLGRGRHLYGENGVESTAFAAAFGTNDNGHSKSEGGEPSTIPMAGFFAGGENGPVGYRSYTHSYTTSLAIFRPRSRNR